MGIIDSIKRDAAQNGTKIQSSEAQKLEKLLDAMFYTDHKPEEELAFLGQVMTRGLESAERKGLHASNMIVTEKKFCLRQQVTSLYFKQLQGEQLPASLLRIFEEGNAIHEKWQRLLIRAGYSDYEWLDRTQWDEGYQLSFSPDVICYIPEMDSGLMVGEIKSVNSFQYKKMERHPSAWKQLQMYLYLLRKHESEERRIPMDMVENYRKGFVLCEDKNTQDFKVEVYDYDRALVEPYIQRLEMVKTGAREFVRTKRPPARHKLCESPECKMAAACPMRDACWNIGEGRVKL